MIDLPMYSSQGTSFFEDMGFAENKNGKVNFWPGVSIFRKTNDGKIERTTRAGFGPGDLFSSIWNLFALLPKGVNDWKPSNESLIAPKGLTLQVFNLRTQVEILLKSQGLLRNEQGFLNHEKAYSEASKLFHFYMTVKNIDTR